MEPLDLGPIRQDWGLSVACRSRNNLRSVPTRTSTNLEILLRMSERCRRSLILLPGIIYLITEDCQFLCNDVDLRPCKSAPKTDERRMNVVSRSSGIHSRLSITLLHAIWNTGIISYTRSQTLPSVVHICVTNISYSAGTID